MKILKQLLKRRLTWLDVDKEIFNEETTKTRTCFGLFTFVNSADIKHTLPDKNKNKIGFDV